MTLQLQPAHRFSTLDALRGVAALLVVQVHLPFLFAAHMPFPHAKLAVDFFFLLSGFVLSFAYGRRLETGWPLKSFLRDRLIRLYPLYLLALPFGMLRPLVAPSPYFAFSRTGFAVLCLLALVMLPAPAALPVGGSEAFPLNLPSWSLFYELAANLLHGLFLRRRSVPQLGALVLVLALLFFGDAFLHGTYNLGPFKGELIAGGLRVSLSYLYGMLLFRLWQGGKLPKFGSAGLAAFLLVATLVYPPLPAGNLPVEAAIILLVFPVVVLLGANAPPSPRLLPLFSLMGTLSYAIYILHAPLYTVFLAGWHALLHSKPADHAPFSGLVYLLVLLLVAYAADRFYDFPARTWLKQRTR